MTSVCPSVVSWVVGRHNFLKEERQVTLSCSYWSTFLFGNGFSSFCNHTLFSHPPSLTYNCPSRRTCSMCRIVLWGLLKTLFTLIKLHQLSKQIFITKNLKMQNIFVLSMSFNRRRQSRTIKLLLNMPDILMQVLHENDYFILMLRKEVDTHMIFRSYSLEFPRIIGILNGRKCICVQIRWYMRKKSEHLCA